MNENVPRYEFRIFGTCLGSAERIMYRLTVCALLTRHLLAAHCYFSMPQRTFFAHYGP